VAVGSDVNPQTAGQSVQEADLWRDFCRDFQALADEQRALVRVMQKGDRRLHAHCGYNSDMTLDESVLINDRLLCLLYRVESGTWQLGEGPSEAFRARFEALATRAGIALHPPLGIIGLDFWLHRLCSYLRKTKSHEFFGCTDTGGYIDDVCQSSATFCSWHEKKALEASISATQQPQRRHGRLRATVYCPSAARKMEAHLESKGIGQTDFASRVGTTDRTLRAFRKTGKVRRDIFESIAKTMGTTKEALLKPE
jgi:hypothetical protein